MACRLGFTTSILATIRMPTTLAMAIPTLPIPTIISMIPFSTILSSTAGSDLAIRTVAATATDFEGDSVVPFSVAPDLAADLDLGEAAAGLGAISEAEGGSEEAAGDATAKRSI